MHKAKFSIGARILAVVALTSLLLACGSKINKDYIKVDRSSHFDKVTCPCCHKSLMSTTDTNRLKRLEDKRREARDKVLNCKVRDTSSGNSLAVVIGGVCSS